MEKKKYIKWIIGAAALVLAILQPTGVLPLASPFRTVITAEAAAKKPGKVKLTKISSSAYNKVKISWKKTSNATRYAVYYKQSGTSKWKKLAAVKSGRTSYTHTSSKKFPIIVGKKYSYTVRAYNSKTKKYGAYNTKGLTVKTKPEKVKLKKASLNSKKTAVTVTWNKTKGCNYYYVYRKAGSSKWKKLATVKSGVLKYVDKKPVKGVKNTYTVRAYYSKTKALGTYNKTGVSVKVPAAKTNSSGTAQKNEKVKYSYKLRLMNTYDELYTDSSGPILYIKTNNPNVNTISLSSSPKAYGEMVLSSDYFGDVKGTQVNNWLKVEGGYLCSPTLNQAGTYKFSVKENGYSTGASITVTIKDYRQARIDWIQSLIAKYTTSSMTPKEKFEAIIKGEFSSNYRYNTVIYDKTYGDYRYATLLREQGALWQTHQLNSYTSPLLMVDIGYLVGYDVQIITFNVSDPMHPYVKGPDGAYYMICPLLETGIIKEIPMIDFSKY